LRKHFLFIRALLHASHYCALPAHERANRACSEASKKPMRISRQPVRETMRYFTQMPSEAIRH